MYVHEVGTSSASSMVIYRYAPDIVQALLPDKAIEIDLSNIESGKNYILEAPIISIFVDMDGAKHIYVEKYVSPNASIEERETSVIHVTKDERMDIPNIEKVQLKERVTKSTSQRLDELEERIKKLEERID